MILDVRVRKLHQHDSLTLKPKLHSTKPGEEKQNSVGFLRYEFREQALLIKLKLNLEVF